jgi:hypothetical protein
MSATNDSRNERLAAAESIVDRLAANAAASRRSRR